MSFPSSGDDEYPELAALGHEDPWDARRDQRYALVHDPAGNHVNLFAPL